MGEVCHWVVVVLSSRGQVLGAERGDAVSLKFREGVGGKLIVADLGGVATLLRGREGGTREVT